MIAECTSAADVAAAVRFARAEGLEIAVRCGAHSVPGLCSCDDGLLLDLRRMNAVSVDPEARRARVQGGALLGEVDAATQPYGLAVPVGIVSHTGIGGLTLGGGMGWLSRLGGLTIDNLVSAEVVVADGRVLRAAEDEHADLLVEAGPMVQFGFFFWGLDQGREALRAMRDVVADLPRTVTGMPAALNAPPAPFVPAAHHGRPGYALMLVGYGSEAEHAQAAERVRTALPPLVEVVTPMPYLALQQMTDDANAWGFYSYDKSGYVPDLTDEVIDVLVEHTPRKTSPMSVVLFYRLDQAFSEVADEATAFGGGRSPRYAALLIGVTPTPGMLPAERNWVRSLYDALRPSMIGSDVYVNAVDGQDPGEVRAAYGTKLRRLAEVKAAYDPDNAFHRNINIAAAAGG